MLRKPTKQELQERYFQKLKVAIIVGGTMTLAFTYFVFELMSM